LSKISKKTITHSDINEDNIKTKEENPEGEMNYTKSSTNTRYFQRNSRNICMGILSIKILKLIFSKMHQDDIVPLP